MSPRSLAAIAALALAVSPLVACGDDDESGGGRTATAPTATTDAGGCRPVSAPKPRREPKSLRAPKAGLDPAKAYTATVASSCGTFAITLDAKRAPRTGASFAALARRGFFDGLAFHRIVPGFVVQGGDPRGDGSGGPGYGVTEEPPSDLAYLRGTVAMAKTQTEPPGRSGSQFFVVVGPDAQLPPEYALLGRVTSGMDVVDRIAALPTGPNDDPIDPVVIDSIKLAESKP